MDPNAKYKTDVLKAAFAYIVTFGAARAFNIHIAWSYSNANGIQDYSGKHILPEDLWFRKG